MADLVCRRPSGSRPVVSQYRISHGHAVVVPSIATRRQHSLAMCECMIASPLHFYFPVLGTKIDARTPTPALRAMG